MCLGACSQTRSPAISTGLNMRLINIVALGAVSLAIGYVSDHLVAAGSAHSWTWPLMRADLPASLAIPFAYLAMCGARAVNETG